MNGEHFEVVKQGANALRQWRDVHPEVTLDLEGADLAGLDLSAIRLRGANLRGASLVGAKLRRATFAEAI